MFATAAGHAIISLTRYRDTREDAIEFERALNSSAAIDQAKGILMAVHRVDADTAFHMLVRTSQLTNTKLRVVAEELLASIYSGSAQVPE
ncbi:ANTAR domain-containing protein [Rhodococcus qingshengii]|uniref:ANTAR domain-containing protein n=1 Tax=Rhodococcus qingshengii TaxID=334542 RepID=UPI001C8C704C|nr:ANTAR domain-containing protein [Rhodococcus qingshengii]MBX9152100.1 ANTAR domain-containing protein [Rhodococcus qingshengii]